MDDERGDGTNAVKKRKQKEKEKSQMWNEVDVVKEEGGSSDMVKYIGNSDQLFVGKMLYVDERELHVMRSEFCAEIEQ